MELKYLFLNFIKVFTLKCNLKISIKIEFQQLKKYNLNRNLKLH